MAKTIYLKTICLTKLCVRTTDLEKSNYIEESLKKSILLYKSIIDNIINYSIKNDISIKNSYHEKIKHEKIRNEISSKLLEEIDSKVKLEIRNLNELFKKGLKSGLKENDYDFLKKYYLNKI